MNLIDSNKVMFYFCVPNRFWKRVLVTRNSNIYCLNQFIDQKNRHSYIYKGSTVDSNLTFNNIGISNDDIIICITNNIDNNLKWKKMSCDQNLHEKLKILSNKNIKNEYNRIRDIRNMKTEAKKNFYKKKVQRFILNDGNKYEFDSTSLNIDYEKLSEPSNEALPILW